MTLNAADRRVLEYIIAYKCACDGNSPSIREIAEACRISSNSVVKYHLRRLELLGRIELDGAGRSRSIRVMGGRWLYIKGEEVRRLDGT